jgi:REP element-mobilizing transposase RayT
MPRKQRTDEDGAIHHVYGRGNYKQPIFIDESDNNRFLTRLWHLQEECRFKIFAYCLLGNHYHLLIETGPVPLAAVMHRALTSYSRGFNDRWDGSGHVFQGRYNAIRCHDDVHFRILIRYIHLNPVEACIAPTPGDWRWSGHNAIVRGGSSLIDRPGVLLRFGGGDSAVKNYLGFLKSAPAPASAERRRTLSGIARDVSKEVGVHAMLLTHRTREVQVVSAKTEFVCRALSEGFRPKEIAKFLGMTQAGVSYLKMRTDPGFK